jgi:hypothetical protein
MPELRLEPGDVEAVAPKVDAMEREAGFPLNLRSLSDDCRRFLLAIQHGGYDDTLEEYLDDYGRRDLLLDVADTAPPETAARIRAWVAAWDAKFVALTREVHGDNVPSLSDREEVGFRIPKNLTPDLREGLEVWGIEL